MHIKVKLPVLEKQNPETAMVAQMCIVVAAQKRKRIAWVQEFKEYMDNMITPSQI